MSGTVTPLRADAAGDVQAATRFSTLDLDLDLGAQAAIRVEALPPTDPGDDICVGVTIGNAYHLTVTAWSMGEDWAVLYRRLGEALTGAGVDLGRDGP